MCHHLPSQFTYMGQRFCLYCIKDETLLSILLVYSFCQKTRLLKSHLKLLQGGWVYNSGVKPEVIP